MTRKPYEKKILMNFRIKPELVNKLDRMSRSSELSMTELVEFGITRLTAVDLSLYKSMKAKNR